MTTTVPTTSTTPETAQHEPSVADSLRTLNNQVRAKIVSDSIKKGLIGAATGAAFSFTIFRRKLAPIWLGMGFGLGMAYSEGSQLLQTSHDMVLEAAIKRYDSEEENKIKSKGKMYNYNVKIK